MGGEVKGLYDNSGFNRICALPDGRCEYEPMQSKNASAPDWRCTNVATHIYDAIMMCGVHWQMSVKKGSAKSKQGKRSYIKARKDKLTGGAE